MIITFRVKGFEIECENKSEEDEVNEILTALEDTYKPTYITWEHGIRIKGKSY